MKRYKKKKYTARAAESRREAYNEYTGDTAEGAAERPSSGISGKKPPRKKKKRKKKRYLLKFFILVIVCAGAYCLLHSSIFDIDRILVLEEGRFTAEQVEDMIGLKRGTNLFEFKAGDCEEKLMENPYIKGAEIKRKLPGTVEIHLDERKEKAVFMQDRHYIVVDSEGIVLRTADQKPKLPVLIGMTVTKAEENKQIAVKEAYSFKKAMKLLAAMEESDLYFKTIDVSRLIVRLYVTDKLFCKGEAKNLLIGMEEGNLKAVLYDLYKKNIKRGIVNVGDDQYYSFSKKVR